jgi:hypothetical protein
VAPAQRRFDVNTRTEAMTAKKTAAKKTAAPTPAPELPPAPAAEPTSAPAAEAPAPPAASDKLQTRIVRRKLKELKLLKKNARYMAEPEFNRLVANLKRDGVLTSLPLVYREEVLSGNHRVQAALKAGIEDADVIEVTSELTQEQQRAIQLSHNALTGKDDPSILREIYESLSLDWQKYSAVYEEMFKLDEEKATSLGVPIAKYQELVIAFLPEDRQAFYDFALAVEKRYRKAHVLVGEAHSFDVLFDAILAVKDGRHIGNTGTALRVMADIVLEHMAQEAAAAPPPPAKAARKTAKAAAAAA